MEWHGRGDRQDVGWLAEIRQWQQPPDIGNGLIVFDCGGNWNNGSNAGVFYCNGVYSRALANSFIGFRSAFVKLPTA